MKVYASTHARIVETTNPFAHRISIDGNCDHEYYAPLSITFQCSDGYITDIFHLMEREGNVLEECAEGERLLELYHAACRSNYNYLDEGSYELIVTEIMNKEIVIDFTSNGLHYRPVNVEEK